MRKLVCLISLVLLFGIGAAQAVPPFSADFETATDYTADLGGFDGLLGSLEDADIFANADIAREGSLYLQSTGSTGDPSSALVGPYLYVNVTGDFVATTKVTDFAGTDLERVYHNNGGLMARAADPMRDGIAGEDEIEMAYFPTWTTPIAWDTDDGARGEYFEHGMWEPFDTFGYSAANPYLKMTRTGSVYELAYGPDGINWMVRYTVDRPDLAGEVQVGLKQCTSAEEAGVTGYIAFEYLDIVPEPATMALLGIGGLALIRRKRS